MITAHYLNKEHKLLSKNIISFSEMMKEVFDRVSNGVHSVENEDCMIFYSYKESNVLLFCLDDLVPEFNLDAFQKHTELKEELEAFYPETEVNLYINLKEELPNFVIENLKPLSVGSDYFEMKSFQSLEFGTGLNKEVYNVDCCPSGPEYEIKTCGTNLDSSMIMIALLPEYGSTRRRFNFRNIQELTDYTLCFCNKEPTETSFYVHDLIFLVSYDKYPRESFSAN